MTLDEFDRACGALPAATRVVQWGGAHVWKLGPRMFAVAWPGHASFACSLKASAMAREIYAGQPGIVPAPYLARAGWLRFTDGALPDAELVDMIGVSHALIVAALPKRLRGELGLAQAPAKRPPAPIL